MKTVFSKLRYLEDVCV